MNIYERIRRVRFRHVGVVVSAVGFVSISGTHVMAQDYGVANNPNAAVVFDASTMATVATIPLPSTSSNFDVSVMPNQSLAFVSRTGDIWVIDLTQHPPALAAGINPIVSPIGGLIVEDLSLTADARFLVVSDGSAASPLGVINTATRTVVGTFNFLPDHNSVDVCDNGSVLVTSAFARVVKRLTISAAGMLVDTGQSLALSDNPNNATCARGGTTGVVVNRATGELRTFLLNGMTLVSTQVLPGTNLGINVSISSDGKRVFGRRANDFITAYNFNSTSGIIGATLWSTNVGARPTFYGVEQMALNPTGNRLFASTANFVLALNANTGAMNGSVSILNPTGIGLRRTARGPADFDGEGITDLGLYRPSTGFWYIKQSSTNYTTNVGYQWGVSTDVAVPGDYDGDGRTDLALYRPSTGFWYILQSSTNFTAYIAQHWGVATDVPVAGDYDGDGKTDLGLYRPSTGTWYLALSSTNYSTYIAQQWGVSSDKVVPGDYDGDGRTDLGLYRPSTGFWYILQSSTNFTAYIAQQWGVATDVPVAGDYDGDRKTDLGLYRPSTGFWYILQSSTNFTAYIAQQWGVSSDLTVPGDYDGDGQTDLALYRPSTGFWYISRSSTNYTTFIAEQWGQSTDIPVLKSP